MAQSECDSRPPSSLCSAKEEGSPWPSTGHYVAEQLPLTITEQDPTTIEQDPDPVEEVDIEQEPEPDHDTFRAKAQQDADDMMEEAKNAIQDVIDVMDIDSAELLHRTGIRASLRLAQDYLADHNVPPPGNGAAMALILLHWVHDCYYSGFQRTEKQKDALKGAQKIVIIHHA